MEKIADIKAALKKFRNDTTWLQLRKRWDADFNFYRLEPYDAGKNYFSYTSNSPANLANKAIGMLSEAKLSIHMPEDTLQKAEIETANNIERFGYGVIGINDDRFLEQDMPSLHDQMCWLAAMRGTVVIVAYVHKEEDGTTFPELRVWDIYNVAYAKGKRGNKWAAYTRTITKSEAKELYDIDIGKAEGTAIMFLDEKNMGVIVENQWGKKLEPHGLDYCPVYIIRAGAMPSVHQVNYQYTEKHRGESILAADRGLFPLLNKSLSDYLTIARRGVKPPMGFWSAGGQKNFDEDIWAVEHGIGIPLDLDDKIAPLIEPTSTTDAKDMISIILGEIQRGGISHIAQGELGFRLSGFAINQLQAALSTIITPFVKFLERAYLVSLYSIQKQYIKGGWQPVEVRGRTSKDQPFGVPQPIKIKPSDLKDWRPEVTLTPVYPKDDAQRYQLARLATEGENPLLSVESAQENIIGVQDTQLEAEKIAAQWASNLPILRLFDAFDAALAEKDMNKAYNVVAQLRIYMAQNPGAASPNQQAAMSSLGAASMQMPGVGIPPGETGMSPQVMPSEMMGGLPGGAMQARMPGMEAEA